ncbi:conserved hypothetical protein [Shewanella halifaxensis HAW-EB4]|uniref:Uncharacterized protein n=1 Tax=Shewanella halifaxensis (strain HAW-EB4) TaxID=458817 RepID=B0TUM1_SHEHH|nr:hypothetical protein [Shewanella halifaxensis]ABZ76749.1 conserved hypothetical protein [Shewanella halifaxensis HAW-EB4]
MAVLRGKALDTEIERELITMVAEGYDRSPITPTDVHRRLVNKGIVQGKLSTLSTSTRKELIEVYRNKQFDDVGGAYASSLRKGSTQSKAAIISKNAQLTEQVKQAQEQLAMNTKVLLSIVTSLKNSGTVANVERCLSPYLIRELKED